MDLYVHLSCCEPHALHQLTALCMLRSRLNPVAHPICLIWSVGLPGPGQTLMAAPATPGFAALFSSHAPPPRAPHPTWVHVVLREGGLAMRSTPLQAQARSPWPPQARSRPRNGKPLQLQAYHSDELGKVERCLLFLWREPGPIHGPSPGSSIGMQRCLQWQALPGVEGGARDTTRAIRLGHARVHAG